MKNQRNEEEELLFLKNNETSNQYKNRKIEEASSKGYLDLFSYLFFVIPKNKGFENTLRKCILTSLKNEKLNIINFIFKENVKITKEICNELVMYATSNNNDLSKYLIEKNYTFDNKHFDWRECFKIAALKENLILLEKITTRYKNRFNIINISDLFWEISNNNKEKSILFLIEKIEKSIFESEITEFEKKEYMNKFFSNVYFHYDFSQKNNLNLGQLLLIANLSKENIFKILIENFNFGKNFLSSLKKYLDCEKLNWMPDELGYYDSMYKETYEFLIGVLSDNTVDVSFPSLLYAKLDGKAKNKKMKFIEYIEYLIDKDN